VNRGRDSVITVADVVIEKIAALGIKHVFFLPGGGCMYLIDALARSCKITGVALLHEQSVGIAAEAYSQYTNALSACIVTTGPGASNAITACAAAWTDSTPMLFISGQVKSADDAKQFGVRQYGFQELPITEMVRAVTKKAVKLEKSHEVHAVLEDLVQTALSGRPGPVWLDIPLDIQNQAVSTTSFDLVFKENTVGSTNLSRKTHQVFLDKMISAWDKSRRPLLLLGNGVRLANEAVRTRELVSRSKTPALLTWKMIDFLDDLDPLNAGRPGSIGQRHANILQQNSDFILCLGARLDLGQVAYRPDNFAPKANKFICDVDLAELSKLPSHFTKINLHLTEFLDLLSEYIPRLEDKAVERAVWIEKTSSLKRQLQLTSFSGDSYAHEINLYDFVELFSDSLQSSDVLVPGSSGACSEVVMQAFKVKLGQRILNSEGLGPMGFGLPASIGVAIACEGRRIYSIDGDGGFLMNIQELVTARHHKLPIVIFLLNNNGYGSIKSTQNAFFSGRLFGTDPESGLGLPCWSSLIQGFGIHFQQLKSIDDCRLFFSQVENLPTPLIVEIIVSKNQRTEPRVATQRMSDGTLRTDDMSDMTPKIPRERLKELQDFLES